MKRLLAGDHLTRSLLEGEIERVFYSKRKLGRPSVLRICCSSFSGEAI
jgi:hypothetical protein